MILDVCHPMTKNGAKHPNNTNAQKFEPIEQSQRHGNSGTPEKTQRNQTNESTTTRTCKSWQTQFYATGAKDPKASNTWTLYKLEDSKNLGALRKRESSRSRPFVLLFFGCCFSLHAFGFLFLLVVFCVFCLSRCLSFSADTARNNDANLTA